METNKRGNIIERDFHSMRERYKYDFELCPADDGWIQYDTDQDAWYFGVWVNRERREIVTFAEGDETRVKCLSEESYRAELSDMAEFYGPPPPAFRSIDADGSVTEYYDTRPE